MKTHYQRKWKVQGMSEPFKSGYTECGKTIGMEAKKVTENKNNVTCKTCLKSIKWPKRRTATDARRFILTIVIVSLDIKLNILESLSNIVQNQKQIKNT